MAGCARTMTPNVDRQVARITRRIRPRSIACSSLFGCEPGHAVKCAGTRVVVSYCEANHLMTGRTSSPAMSQQSLRTPVYAADTLRRPEWRVIDESNRRANYVFFLLF